MGSSVRIFGWVVVAGAAVALAGCGGDDESGTAIESPEELESELERDPESEARLEAMAKELETSGLRVTVTPLTFQALEGAEAGVEITGEANGSVRVFASEEEAQQHSELYTDEALGETILYEGETEFNGLGEGDAQKFAEAFE